jgi:hypothetical protein
MFPPLHESFVFRLLPIIHRDTVCRHTDNLGFLRRDRVLLGTLSHAIALDQHLCDALLRGLEQAQHRCAAGGLGLAGQRARIREGFEKVVLLDKKG